MQTATSGNLGTVFQQKTIEALPIVGTRGRNPLELVTPQPGVVSGANTGGGTHVYGARDRSWNYTLDGIDINETSAGGANFSPLRTNPDSHPGVQGAHRQPDRRVRPQQRRPGGHGHPRGHEPVQGHRLLLHARPEAERERVGDQPRRDPETSRRQGASSTRTSAGSALGGPIMRNKTFFFGNLQVLRAQPQSARDALVYTDSGAQGHLAVRRSAAATSRPA